MEESRVVLVTGGGGAIGGAISRALAAAGHRVAVADIDPGCAEVVAREVGGIGIPLDVTSPASVEAAVARTRQELGAVEVLVSSAGWDEFMPFLETDEAFSAKVLEINLAGPIRVTRAVLGPMVESGWGRVIHIASDAGRVGSSMEAVYSGAKGGVIAFAKTVAREVARHGVTCNSVCPGPTDTAMLWGAAEPRPEMQRLVQGLERAVPMRRLGRPDDIAPAVVFLASEAAGFVTGQTLSVSGGLTMS